jgi:4-hydroxy-3-polyprenylbenzoate decarboxylase
MAWDGLGTFVRALEERAELVRIRTRVDPNLEVSAIADRVMKAGGPALLFEDVAGSSYPLLINAYGSRRRMSMALGVEDLAPSPSWSTRSLRPTPATSPSSP